MYHLGPTKGSVGIAADVGPGVGTVRLDGVEVKVSVESDQTLEALRLLGLGDVAPWRVFFVEDVTVGLGSATPLLDQHLIIRAREKTKGADDVTVKFRPGRRSQLTDSWLRTTETGDGDLDTELKIEQDWARDRRVLSISLTAERPTGSSQTLRRRVTGSGVCSVGISADCIEQCADVPVNLATLTVLPAVTARRWPTFPVPGPRGTTVDVRAERWSVLDLDFLELSAAVDTVEAAAPVQAALAEFVQTTGLRSSVDQAKTSLVLERLVAAATSPT